MGFLDQMKQGTQRAAWEAERMVRQQKANSAVGDARRDVEAQIFNLGKVLMQSYDAGTTPPPEAAPVYEQIRTLTAKVKQLEDDLERIKQEQPPTGVAPAAPPPAAGYTPPPAAYTPPAGGAYAPTGPAPAAYTPSGPAPAAYTPPAADAAPIGAAVASAPAALGFCQNCGAARKDPGAQFCQECGTRYQ